MAGDRDKRSRRAVALYAYQALILAAAVPVSWFAVTHDADPGRGSLPLFLGLAAALVVVDFSPMKLGNARDVDFDFTDAVVLVAVALEGTGAALVTALAFRTAATLIAPRSRWALMFNMGEQAIGTCVAALIVGRLGVGGSPADMATALVVAGTARFAINLSAAVVLFALKRESVREMFLRPGLICAGMFAGAVCSAVVVVLLGTTAPWAMPFSVGPLVLVALAYRAQQEASRDKARLRGLVEAAADIQQAPTADAVAAEALAAARRLVSPAARLTGADPGRALAAALGSGGRDWVVVDDGVDRARADILQTIGSIASTASDKVELIARARHEALHDGLTGLGNMRLLTDAFGQQLRAREADATGGAVLFVDLDRFKAVNDELGHDVGDRLLQAVAARLRANVRSGDVVGRLGGDEFVVLCPGAGRIVALQLAERLQGELAKPFRIGPHSVEIGGSVGNACWPDDGEDFEDLLRVADASMYESKRSRRRPSEIR